MGGELKVYVKVIFITTLLLYNLFRKSQHPQK